MSGFRKDFMRGAYQVPADDNRSYPALRDYQIPLVGDEFRQINQQGNYLQLDNIKTGQGAGFGPATLAVEFLLNDSQRIVLFEGEAIETHYNTVAARVINGAGNYTAQVVLGFGRFYETSPPPVMTAAASADNLVDSSVTPIRIAQADRNRGEIRINVAADQPNGVLLGFGPTFTSQTAVWLERGQVEFWDYAGEIWALLKGGDSPAFVNMADFPSRKRRK